MSVDIQTLSVRYGATRALDGVTLTAKPGEVLAVLGPNGSGKSSLVKAIAGLVRYTGQIVLAGSATRDSIGYMPQDTATRAALTVLEAVLLGRLGQLGLRVKPADVELARQVLTELDIAALAGRYLGELSGGQRQLVFLAQALAAEPKILLLDEPISALDIRHQLEVMEVVRRLTHERVLTTLVILHDLNIAARFADQAVLFHGGKVVGLGAPADIIDALRLAQVFGVEAAFSTTPDGRLVVTPVRPCRSPKAL
ncbi:ABC transporter ATP-binding protein [Chelatococcus asaccharovorans]|uniref:Iron complex transport system ATP-binding protein n=1 Tax=Chelatococcus asaccharovorans TaxID=28210 RepID=A0A2V3U8Y2_9HYPH|nr:ABC transporter ATP-binding protein [Chelatococcus asaccharovorans]MBS7705435.1 ABC transporter ATP-binding protein [Chelatococcus asaccharovorans]PXW60161.1 iron complex transport system ATP-binding protein [Chelatococcus asaccharovorans]